MYQETTSPCDLSVTSRTPDQVAGRAPRIRCTRDLHVYVLKPSFAESSDKPNVPEPGKTFRMHHTAITGHVTKGGLRTQWVEEIFTSKFGSMDRSGWFLGFLWCSSQAPSSCTVTSRRHEAGWCIRIINESIRSLANTGIEAIFSQSAIRSVYICPLAVSLRRDMEGAAFDDRPFMRLLFNVRKFATCVFRPLWIRKDNGHDRSWLWQVSRSTCTSLGSISMDTDNSVPLADQMPSGCLETAHSWTRDEPLGGCTRFHCRHVTLGYFRLLHPVAL